MIGLLASAVMALGIPLLAQPTAQNAVAMVREPAGAIVRRQGFESGLSAQAGDLLYPGDRLESGANPAAIWFCPTREALTLAPSASWIAGNSPPPSIAIVARSMLASCQLPNVPGKLRNTPRFYGAALARGAPVAAEANATPLSDLPAGLAEAAALQQAGRHKDAANQFARIAKTLPGVDWPRILEHEELDLQRRTSEVPDQPSESGRTWVLAVGISKFQRLAEDQQLEFADRDATVFAEYMQSPRGGTIPASQVRLLTNQQATAANIRNAIATFLRKSAGPTDTIVLFVAAHGTVKEGHGYIIAHDSDPEDLAATGLPMDEIRSLLESEVSQVGRVLLYVDVCRAGAIGIFSKGRNRIHEYVKFLLDADRTKTYGLLASGSKENSYESERFGGGHGAFSYFLIRGLNGDGDFDHDGRVTAGELYRYVLNGVSTATLQKQNPEKTGDLEASYQVAAKLSDPGVTLSDWRPLEALAVKRALTRTAPLAATAPSTQPRSAGAFELAIAQGRLDPADPNGAFALFRELAPKLPGPEARLAFENRLRVAAQDRGQEVLLQYLRGERVPQTRAAFEAGERYFNAALELDPEAWALKSRALFCRARALIFSRQYDEALADLQRAARLEPRASFVFNAIGIAQLEQARYRDAIAALHDSVRLAPDWLYPRHNLALALAESGRYDDAVRVYREAIRMAPDAAFLRYNLGLLLQRLNRRAEARRELELALRREPSNDAVETALGVLAADGRKTTQAEQRYRGVLERNADFVPAAHNLALLLSAHPTRAAEAGPLWSKILAAHPDFTPARAAYAEWLENRGDLASAAAQLEGLADPALKLQLARVYLKASRLAESASLLDAMPPTPASLILLGDVRAAQGRTAESQSAWRQALQLGPGESERRELKKRLRRG